jgi:hypothetical protein
MIVAQRLTGRRASALLFALALQAATFALLITAMVAPPLLPAKKEEIIYLMPPPQRAPMIIDARQRPSKALPPPAAGNLPATRGGTATAPETAAPATAPAATPQPRPRQEGAAPPIAKPVPSDRIELNPPSGVKDEERWAAEKQRRGGQERVEVAPDVSVGPGGPGVSVIFVDPLCHLTALVLGPLHCGPPPRSTAPATEAQFKKALEAYQARHGYGPLAKPAAPRPAVENDSTTPPDR